MPTTDKCPCCSTSLKRGSKELYCKDCKVIKKKLNMLLREILAKTGKLPERQPDMYFKINSVFKAENINERQLHNHRLSEVS